MLWALLNLRKSTGFFFPVIQLCEICLVWEATCFAVAIVMRILILKFKYNCPDLISEACLFYKTNIKRLPCLHSLMQTLEWVWKNSKVCTILYYTILYHTIPYHTIPYHTIPYHTIPYHTIPYYTILYCTVLCYPILCYPILIPYTMVYWYYTILILYSCFLAAVETANVWHWSFLRGATYYSIQQPECYNPQFWLIKNTVISFFSLQQSSREFE